MTTPSLAEQFRLLPKEKQMNVFLEIQEIIFEEESNKLPKELLDEVERREKEILEGRVEAIPYDVALAELRNAI